jgi:hypothetical protein
MVTNRTRSFHLHRLEGPGMEGSDALVEEGSDALVGVEEADGGLGRVREGEASEENNLDGDLFTGLAAMAGGVEGSTSNGDSSRIWTLWA